MNRAVRPVDPSQLRPLSRIAVALRRHTPLCEAGTRAAALASGALQKELSAPFSCMPRLLEPPARTGGLPRGCCYAVFALAADGRRALLEIEAGFAAMLVDRLSGGTCAAFAPSELCSAEAAALSYLALHALRAIRTVELVEQTLSPRLLWMGAEARAASALLIKERSWVAIELELRAGEVEGLGRLLVPGISAQRLARAAGAGAPRGPLAPEIGRAAIEARLVVRAARAEGRLEDLARGDAVRLSTLRRGQAGLCGQVSLLFDGFRLEGSIEGRSFALAFALDALPMEGIMKESATQICPLPIEVQVELARFKVPLAKLDQLRPGSVIDLVATLADPVVLRIGDRAVAKAELVDLEGGLGARILALLP